MQWVGSQVMGTGLVQIWPGTPVAQALIDGDRVTGVIAVMDPRKHLYDESSVRLLTTLASSMSVALENVRLFDETKGALERQTALGEILRVMASSPTSEQPVLDAIARNEKASFCVIAADDVVQSTFTTHFRSAVVFGKARVSVAPAWMHGS